MEDKEEYENSPNEFYYPDEDNQKSTEKDYNTLSRYSENIESLPVSELNYIAASKSNIANISIYY